MASDGTRDVRKVVTVLFCDLAGYTSAGDGLDPEALRSLQSGTSTRREPPSSGTGARSRSSSATR